MKLYTQMERKLFQKHIALNLEHRNLLVSILGKDFPPDLKKQIEVGWVVSPLKLQPHFKLQTQL